MPYPFTLSQQLKRAARVAGCFASAIEKEKKTRVYAERSGWTPGHLRDIAQELYAAANREES